jgi:hypothetical protein
MRWSAALVVLLVVILPGPARAEEPPHVRLEYVGPKAGECRREDLFRSMLRGILRAPLLDPSAERVLSVHVEPRPDGGFHVRLVVIGPDGAVLEERLQDYPPMCCVAAVYFAAVVSATMIAPPQKEEPPLPPPPAPSCPACDVCPVPPPPPPPPSPKAPAAAPAPRQGSADQAPLILVPRFAFSVGAVGVFGSVPGFIAPGVTASVGVRWRPLSLSAEVRAAWGLERLPQAPSLRPWALTLAVPVCGHWEAGPFLCGVVQVEGVGIDYQRIETRQRGAFGVRGGFDVAVRGAPFSLRVWGEAVLRPIEHVLRVELADGSAGREVYRGYPFGGAVGLVAAF